MRSTSLQNPERLAGRHSPGRGGEENRSAVGATAAGQPRLGFLGTGWIGRHRMEAIVREKAAIVTMIYDPSEAMAAEAAAAAPEARMAASFEEMLEAGLDGIVIATPSAMHAEQSIAALRSGAAVFCQKPLGRSAEEAAGVVGTARDADLLLGVDLSYRFTEGAQRVRELVAQGEIGAVYAADLVFHNAYGPDKEWFYDLERSGGGCVMDLGIHLVDLALWTLGFPNVDNVTSRLFSRARPLTPGEDAVEDYGVARLDLDTGAAVQLACSWNLPAGCDARIEATFYGSEGGLSLRNVNGSFFDFEAQRFRGTETEVLASPPDDWGGRAAVDWAQRLGRGDRFDAEADRLTQVAAILDRIYGR